MPTWKEVTTRNPSHSENYARRWKNMQAQGQDIDGEARLIDAIAERGSRILDAGCGTGRLGGYLAQRGHKVTGVDIDPILIGHAKADFPEATWHLGDLSEDPIPGKNYDIVVSAGNVMGFLAPEGRQPALDNMFRALRPHGRAVIGFGQGRGWEFQDFLQQAQLSGFSVEFLFESWDLLPFTEESTFIVAFLRKG